MKTLMLVDSIRHIIEYSGDDPDRPGLLDTPTRFKKAWQHHMQGYKLDPKDVLKYFQDGAEAYDEMVIVKDIPFYSHCEHHLAPFFGRVSIGYIPNGRIVGLSKLARLVDIYAHRLQVQERMTVQIATSLNECLTPAGTAVIVTARHLCMESRGICKQGHETITSAMRGVFVDDINARQEFLHLIRRDR